MTGRIPFLRNKVHSARLDDARLKAEWVAAQSAFRGPILHLRDRGDKARTSARIFLWAVIVTVVFGLVFYLAFPFAILYLDGRKITLNENIDAADGELLKLDKERDTVRDSLLSDMFLAGTITLSGTVGALFTGAIEIGTDEFLLYGDNTAIQYVNLSDEWSSKIELTNLVSSTVVFKHAVPLDSNRTLIYGDEGTIVEYDKQGATASKRVIPASSSTIFTDHALLGDDRVLIVGNEGALIEFNPEKTLPFKVALPGFETIEFEGIEKVGENSVLLYGSRGAILRYDFEDRRSTVLNTPDQDLGSFLGHMSIDDNTILLYGSGGTLAYYSLRTQSIAMLDLKDGTDGALTGSMKVGQTSLIFGQSGTVIRYYAATGAVDKLILPGAESMIVNGVAEIDSPNVLIYGELGPVFRYNLSEDTSTMLDLAGSETVYFKGSYSDEHPLSLLYGDEGAIIEYDRLSGTATRLVQQELKPLTFTGHAEVDQDTLLLFGSGEAVAVVTRRRLNKDTIGGLKSDAALTDVIQGLEAEMRDLPRVQAARTELRSITERREVVLSNQTTAQRKLDDFWSRLLDLNEELASFEEFMGVCRGHGAAPIPTTDAPPEIDGLTLACTEAWQAKLTADGGSLWELLAQKVPPAVLLLFLLATLSGLYRYNLRLSGFHHSRADALELISLGRADEVGAMTDAEIKALVAIAEPLAADKVVVSGARTPIDQAIDMAKVILSKKV